jgi:hypothetical protein
MVQHKFLIAQDLGSKIFIPLELAEGAVNGFGRGSLFLIGPAAVDLPFLIALLNCSRVGGASGPGLGMRNGLC